jgi:hypothetical protein
VLASGSKLQSISVAQTSPVETLELPATMTTLALVNLPKLVYPDGGLTIEGLSNVTRLQLSGCEGVDGYTLLSEAIAAGAAIKDISMTDLDVIADGTILDALIKSGAKGIGTDLDEGCDGLTGRWLMTQVLEDDVLAKYTSYFHPADVGLSIYNAQFTTVCFDDTIDDPKNITNIENGTTGETYEASGHIMRIRKALIPVFGQLNTETGKWEGKRMSDSNYTKLYDGSDFDYKDATGTGNDAMMRFPRCWYKGINDFKNQKKYICWSSLENEPLSTAKKVIRKTLASILVESNKTVQTSGVNIGSSTIEDEGILVDTSNYSSYAIEVKGMKQVRWPGINHAVIGGVFVDAAGKIISKFNMAVNSSLFDFVEGDYIFTDVPTGAVKFYFSTKDGFSTLEAIAVDSSNIEAIEPDWVLNEAWLGGIYEASVDSLTQLRSVSGAAVKTGTGTSTTSTEWTYDNDGRPKNTPLSSMNYTCKDFQNLAMRRGEGYQLFDYEMSKLAAILWMSINGTRDVQLAIGYGRSAGGSTGYMDSIGNSDSQRSSGSNGNKCLGFESFVACTYEWMDNVAVNVPSWTQYLKDKGVQSTSYPINAVWHIYDPLNKTERTVQGINESGYCISRTKHGRYCDVIASKLTSDNSSWAKNYCDVQYYTKDRCRVVGRANNNANAYGGIVYAYASGVSSNSGSSYGARSAFRGEIVISE